MAATTDTPTGHVRSLEVRPRLEVAALTALRVMVGIVMLAHGTQKLADFDAFQAQLRDLGVFAPELLAYPSVAAEALGGICLLFGFGTVIAAAFVVVQMLSAVFLVHIDNGLFAANGGFELPLTLAAAALYFVARGAGPISLDAVIALAWPKKPAKPERFSLRTLESHA